MKVSEWYCGPAHRSQSSVAAVVYLEAWICSLLQRYRNLRTQLLHCFHGEASRGLFNHTSHLFCSHASVDFSVVSCSRSDTSSSLGGRARSKKPHWRRRAGGTRRVGKRKKKKKNRGWECDPWNNRHDSFLPMFCLLKHLHRCALRGWRQWPI